MIDNDVDWLDEKIVTSRYSKLYELLEDIFYLIPDWIFGV